MEKDCEVFIDPDEDEVFFGQVTEKEINVCSKLQTCDLLPNEEITENHVNNGIPENGIVIENQLESNSLSSLSGKDAVAFCTKDDNHSDRLPQDLKPEIKDEESDVMKQKTEEINDVSDEKNQGVHEISIIDLCNETPEIIIQEMDQVVNNTEKKLGELSVSSSSNIESKPIPESVQLDHNYSTPVKVVIDKSILSTPKSIVKPDKDGGYLKVLSEIALEKAEADKSKPQNESEKEDENKENKQVNNELNVPDITITEASPLKPSPIKSPTPKKSNYDIRRFRIMYNTPEKLDLLDEIGLITPPSEFYSSPVIEDNLNGPIVIKDVKPHPNTFINATTPCSSLIKANLEIFEKKVEHDDSVILIEDSPCAKSDSCKGISDLKQDGMKQEEFCEKEKAEECEVNELNKCKDEVQEVENVKVSSEFSKESSDLEGKSESTNALQVDEMEKTSEDVKSTENELQKENEMEKPSLDVKITENELQEENKMGKKSVDVKSTDKELQEENKMGNTNVDDKSTENELQKENEMGKTNVDGKGTEHELQEENNEKKPVEPAKSKNLIDKMSESVGILEIDTKYDKTDINAKINVESLPEDEESSNKKESATDDEHKPEANIRMSEEARKVIEVLKDNAIDDTFNFTVPEIDIDRIDNSFMSPNVTDTFNDSLILPKTILTNKQTELLNEILAATPKALRNEIADGVKSPATPAVTAKTPAGAKTPIVPPATAKTPIATRTPVAPTVTAKTQIATRTPVAPTVAAKTPIAPTVAAKTPIVPPVTVKTPKVDSVQKIEGAKGSAGKHKTTEKKMPASVVSTGKKLDSVTKKPNVTSAKKTPLNSDKKTVSESGSVKKCVNKLIPDEKDGKIEPSVPRNERNLATPTTKPAIATTRIPKPGSAFTKIPIVGKVGTCPMKAQHTPGKGSAIMSRRIPSFSKIESPVNAYIHNKPTPLVVNIKPEIKKDSTRKIWVNQTKSAQKSPENNSQTKEGSSQPKSALPFVEYRSATPLKLEKPVESRLPRLAPTMKKLINTNSPTVLKHEGRIHLSEPRKPQTVADESSIIVNPNEVSVVVSHVAQKSNTIK